jgi:hypothetical protein
MPRSTFVGEITLRNQSGYEVPRVRLNNLGSGVKVCIKVGPLSRILTDFGPENTDAEVKEKVMRAIAIHEPRCPWYFPPTIIDINDSDSSSDEDEVDGFVIKSHKKICIAGKPTGFGLVVGGDWKRGKFSKEIAKNLSDLPSVKNNPVKTRASCTDDDMLLVNTLENKRHHW